MKITTNDKILAYLALLSGLTISGVAIYYSVAGLVAIFAAAVVPIIVMGVALEVSKLVATVWLKLNWKRAPYFIRTYLLISIMILMVITSMGIFGFLSKAHSDQSLVSGDVLSKIAIYDEKIKTAKENIEANRKQLKQMDEAVDQTLARSSDEKGADKAANLRRAQLKDRRALALDIETNQKLIATLNDEAAPIRAEVRKVEAEVGPIKYIAAFIYGDNPDANVLEKAVTWVIIIIVAVFDPLAVILLLASQYSFQWFREQREKEEAEGDSPVGPTGDVVISDTTVTEQPGFIAQEVAEVVPDAVFQFTDNGEHPKDSFGYEVEEPPVEPKVEETLPAPIEQWNEMIAEAEAAVAQEELLEEEEILNSALESEKVAMTAWKHDNPDSSLKFQRKLFERGAISELPWMSYIDTAAEEAQKWAEENPQIEEAASAKEWAEEKILTAGLDDRPGDYVTYMENVDGEQVKKVLDGYQQNAEQGEGTLWKRIQDRKQ